MLLASFCRKEGEEEKMIPVDEETAKRIQGWAWIIAGSFRCFGGVFDQEDLASIGTMQALRMLSRWDPEKGSLCTYMSYCIRGAILDYLRQYLKGKRKDKGYLEQNTFRFGVMMEDWGDDSDLLLDELMEGPNEDGSQAFEAREFLKQWRQRLSRRDYLLLILRYGRGMTMSEVGRVLGCTQSRVSQLECRLRKQLGLPSLRVSDSHGNGRKMSREVMMGMR
jgi:RNA polymerase sigma factor (sigma-70 family)